ncbi:hypothetical protein MMC08_001527 [Hypocenomyce scalaris]|nr:hypothetical protein [Hypocenomyce scalaris]
MERLFTIDHKSLSDCTAGIGAESVLALAKHNPEHIYFSGRDYKKASALIHDIEVAVPNAKLTFLECDLASLASVKAAAQQFNSPRLDILMCNAGIMAAPPRIDQRWLRNPLSAPTTSDTPFYQIAPPDSPPNRQPPQLRRFRAHPTAGISFKDLRTAQDVCLTRWWVRYGQRKLANILYAAELARRYPNITAVSIHPGVVATDLVGNLGFAKKLLVYVSQLAKLKTPGRRRV